MKRDGSVPVIPPRVIRSRLLLEQAGEFDSEYRKVMSDALESLDLDPVWEMLRRWEQAARAATERGD